MLTKHSTVEVSCNDPTFHGAWYTATIIDEIRLSPTKKTNISYLVKYDTLFLKKDDSFHPLVEVVDPSFVRPSPPRNIRRNNANDADVAVVEKKGEGGGGFEVGDVVDAYYKDGWWIGAVKSVIIDDGEIRKYVVLFENNTREEFEFDGCKLRFHVDWVDCRWIIPPKKTPEQLLGDRNATDKALSGFITPSIGAHITETVGSAKKNHRSREKPESNSAADSSRGKRFRPSAGSSRYGPQSSAGTTNEYQQNWQSSAGTTNEYQQNWPFIKRSPIWDTIELYSQKPHFAPLKEMKVELREGLAIGQMVTFGNLVQRLLDLQPSDPVDILNNSLETLRDLETHGFDVGPIRGRLNELLSLKNKVCLHEDTRKEVEKVLQKYIHEKFLMEEEIDQLEVKIQELKSKTVHAATVWKRKEEEVTRLRSKSVLVRNQINDWELAFEKLAGTPL